MSQTKLLKFKTYPTNLLYQAYFKFEENFMKPINLPSFPKELYLDSSELKRGLERISAFAISKYLIQDLISLRPKKILKDLFSLPHTLFSTISKSRSRY